MKTKSYDYQQWCCPDCHGLDIAFQEVLFSDAEAHVRCNDCGCEWFEPIEEVDETDEWDFYIDEEGQRRWYQSYAGGE